MLIAPIAMILGWGYWVQAYRVPYGTKIAGNSLAALRWDSARLTVVQIAKSCENRRITFQVGTRSCEATPKEMGIVLDVGSTMTKLAKGVRASGFWSRVLAKSNSVIPEILVDNALLGAFVEHCESEAIAERPDQGRLLPKEGTRDGSMVIVPAKPGKIIDRRQLVASIQRALVRSDDSSVPLALEVVPPRPTLEALQRAAVRAAALASKPIVMSAPLMDKRITLLRSEIAKLVEWKPKDDGELDFAVSRPQFEQWLLPRRHRVEEPAHNATYRVNGKDRLELTRESAGSRIATEQLLSRLESALREGRHTLEIPFEPSELPKLKLSDIENLNIHELVSSFTTRHACCQHRVNNIHRIADLVNGAIVLPGATFSLNEFVGPRTLENGFVAAPSIQDGDMMDSIGGGISQFATTFYNAAMRGGYEILERQAHSYWFDRYPMGHEATLTWPKPDLVIRNDTASGLLIIARYDEKSITVRFYGDGEGRKVSWGVSPRFDIVLPKTEYLPNYELEPDKDKIKDAGCIGWSVTTTRTVELRDHTRHEDRRKVIYKPRIRRVEVHPCRIPAGEPGATGEKCPEPKVEETTESTPQSG